MSTRIFTTELTWWCLSAGFVILWFGGVESWRTVLIGDPKLYLVVFLLTGIAPGPSAWRLLTLVHT